MILFWYIALFTVSGGIPPAGAIENREDSTSLYKMIDGLGRYNAGIPED